LLRGKTVPDELVIECIELCILDVQCQIRGYVLDGYPVTKNQVKLMTERALIPVKVIELKCDVKEVMHRCVRDRMARDSMAMTWQGSSANKSGKGKGKEREKVVLHDSPEVIGFKLKEWKQNIGFIRDWYKNEHKCLVELDAHQSKWFEIILD
jgi:adenylate/nucleoside-diphosphate kinase